jgi:hypothetical protein
VEAEHVTADGAYDTNPVYDAVSEKFTDVEIAIPQAVMQFTKKKATLNVIVIFTKLKHLVE